MGFTVKKTREDHEAENQKDEKEEANMKPYKYFVNILDNIDYKKITDITEHYKFYY